MKRRYSTGHINITATTNNFIAVNILLKNQTFSAHFHNGPLQEAKLYQFISALQLKMKYEITSALKHIIFNYNFIHS